MIIDPLFLLYGAIFLGVLLLVEGISYLMADKEGRGNANRRMKMLASGASTHDVYKKLRRTSRRGNQAGPVLSLYAWFDRLVTQSGVSISTHRMLMLIPVLWGISFVALLVVASRVSVISPSVAGSAVIALLISILLPVYYLSSERKKRLKNFGEQLPDALDVMVRSLQAGHPINASLELVSKEMSDPIGSEFGVAIDEMTYGLDLRQALENMTERIDLPDLKYVVVSINIQHETGGNLAEILAGLSTVIRDRFRMFKKIRALSAEGRISAVILSALPFMVGANLLISKPNYYLDVLDDPLFLPGIGIVAVLMSVGIYIMYRMVNFRI